MRFFFYFALLFLLPTHCSKNNDNKNSTISTQKEGRQKQSYIEIKATTSEKRKKFQTTYIHYNNNIKK